MAPAANCGSNEQTLPAAPGAALNMTGQCTASFAAAGPAGNLWLAAACLVGLPLVMSLL